MTALMTALIRQEDWPERMMEQVQLAQTQPYLIGQHDCLRFSCQVIEAMTGQDFWPRFAGYQTRREAVQTLERIAPTLELAAAEVLGVEPVPSSQARRGDLVLYGDRYGDHLGVCLGATVALLGPQGLCLLRLDAPGIGNCLRVG